MTVQVGVVMDPIDQIVYKKDSTLAMLWAVQDKGWQLWYMQQEDLFFQDNQVFAVMRPLIAFADPEHWYELGEAQLRPLAELDVVLMRKDPPFDNEFIYSTYLLERAEQQGTLIVNKPQSLRDCNEKFFATQFSQCTPPLLVSRRDDLLRAFHAQHGDVVFKPLDGMGGASIFRVRPGDSNLGVIIETLTQQGQQQIMAQKYLPEIVQGDKRILLIDGEPIPYCLARIPQQGENRGNLAAGGRGEARELSERDRWICQQVGPVVKEKGLIFVGLDVIGDYLTEVNVTSPTCIREIDAAYDVGIANKLMDAIDARLKK